MVMRHKRRERYLIADTRVCLEMCMCRYVREAKAKAKWRCDALLWFG
jgi:hypothetical protein